MDTIARRFSWHDFRKPGWVLLTVEAAVRNRNVFARIGKGSGDFRATPLGRLAERLLRERCDASRGALVLQAVQAMPDHIHALLHVARPLERPIGSAIGAWKAAVVSAARRELGLVPGAALWAPGFDFRIKTTPEGVAAARLYTARNPAAARAKRAARARFGAAGPVAHPRLPAAWPPGTALEGLPDWAGFGNAALLDAERLVAVRVSRSEPEPRLRRCEDRARALAREGAVLVSPAVSPGEKRSIAAALAAGGRAILLTVDSVDRYYKPASDRLAACSQGRLLVLGPFPGGLLHPDKAVFEALNALARAIAGA